MLSEKTIKVSNNLLANCPPHDCQTSCNLMIKFVHWILRHFFFNYSSEISWHVGFIGVIINLIQFNLSMGFHFFVASRPKSEVDWGLRKCPFGEFKRRNIYIINFENIWGFSRGCKSFLSLISDFNLTSFLIWTQLKLLSGPFIF